MNQKKFSFGWNILLNLTSLLTHNWSSQKFVLKTGIKKQTPIRGDVSGSHQNQLPRPCPGSAHWTWSKKPESAKLKVVYRFFLLQFFCGPVFFNVFCHFRLSVSILSRITLADRMILILIKYSALYYAVCDYKVWCNSLSLLIFTPKRWNAIKGFSSELTFPRWFNPYFLILLICCAPTLSIYRRDGVMV